MDQRIILLYETSIEQSLKRLVAQAGFEPAEISELKPALETLSVADARWQCLSAGAGTMQCLPALVAGLRDIPSSLRPFVIVVSDKASAADALMEGVDEMIALPITVEELAPKLRPSRRFIELQTQFRKQALRDPLTGVLNRRAVLDMLERELLRAHRLAYPVSVAMLDLDRFKPLNDTHGHIAGDAALSALAARVHSQLRPYDAVGRFGGDEFLLVLTSCTASQGQIICERIRTAICSTPFATAGTMIDLSVSIGLVAVEAGEMLTMESVIERADVALYKAKNTGRNKVVVAG